MLDALTSKYSLFFYIYIVSEMPSWWGKSTSKDVKTKPSKEKFFHALHRFLVSNEPKRTPRGPRGRFSDTRSEKGSLSRAVSRSPSPSNHVSRCQSFTDGFHAQPLPLPQLRTCGMTQTPSKTKVSRTSLEKHGRPPLALPSLPASDNIMSSRLDAADVDGDLPTASISSNCSSDSDGPADLQLQSPVRNGIKDSTKNLSVKSSSLLHKEQPPSIVHKESKSNTKHAHPPCKNQLSTSPKNGVLSASNVQYSRHGAFVSAPDSSLSSPSRSPMRLVFPEQIPSSVFWQTKPYTDINFLGSGQCSSPGSGQTSGHNSMGGDMSGQLFWQQSRASPECSPIPSPRMTSPGPSSRINSGAVTPLHPRAGGTAPGSPTGRMDDGKKKSHPLPLPPINVSNPSPFLPSSTTLSSSAFSRSPGKPDNPPSPGSRWKKGKLIGRGTFGHVYVGFNSESGEMCAMKEVTLFDDAKSRESAKQLGQEVNLLSRLRHQNIVQYYGSETVDDKLYIYLEYVSGGSIHKLLQEYGQFGEQAIRNYTHQILSGLAYLHAKNTVHRDIKGANILVDPSGRVKLADFGMAKHISGQSCPLSFKGSPYWMAPEVIKNSNGCNLVVDIWSLGCTVLEMATSKPPWSQYEGIAAMFKIGNSKELPEIPSNLSDDGKDFIRQCLQREPSKRPTAAELLQHAFVKNVVLERPTLGVSHTEDVSDHVGVSKGLRRARNLSSLNIDGLAIQRFNAAKASAMCSDSHTRNISCPVSPIGSPLLISPRRINGMISPSPASSPKNTSGSSTPLSGCYGALPSKNVKQSSHIPDGYGGMLRSQHNFNVHSPAFHDNNQDPFRRTQTGSPVFREYMAPETDLRTLPSVLSDPVSQHNRDHAKTNPSLDLITGSSNPGQRSGI